METNGKHSIAIIAYLLCHGRDKASNTEGFVYPGTRELANGIIDFFGQNSSIQDI